MPETTEARQPLEGRQPEEGRRTCGARTKADGSPCRRPPVPGRSRCRLHGGATPVGLASVHTKHSRYSRHLPAGLLQRVAEAEADPDLLSLRSEAALVTARVAELVSRLHSGEAGSLWRELRDQWAALERARGANDQPGMAAALAALKATIQAGATEETRWAELARALVLRERLVKSEWGRLVEMRQVITAEAATVFAMNVLDAVTAELGDQPAVRGRIATRIQGLLSHKEDGRGGARPEEAGPAGPGGEAFQ